MTREILLLLLLSGREKEEHSFSKVNKAEEPKLIIPQLKLPEVNTNRSYETDNSGWMSIGF